MGLLLSVEPLLHAGHEHPSTLLIAVSAVVSFVLGVGVGVFGTGAFGIGSLTPERATDADSGTDGDET